MIIVVLHLVHWNDVVVLLLVHWNDVVLQLVHWNDVVVLQLVHWNDVAGRDQQSSQRRARQWSLLGSRQLNNQRRFCPVRQVSPHC